MSGDDVNDKASAAAFEALFAAAEECVDRIADKRTGDTLREGESLPDTDADNGEALSGPQKAETESSAFEAKDDPDAEEATDPPQAQSVPPLPTRTTPAVSVGAKSSVDSAITLSLIKARDELGSLLANETKKAAQLAAENQRLTQRVEKFKAKRDTVRERGQRERDAAIEGATDALIKEFLPVLDNLERALQVEIDDLPEAAAAQVGGLRNGVDGVVQMCRASLIKFDVVHFDAVGEIFDPNLHEAIRRVNDDSVPNNQVVEQYHRGYRRGERLLRAALVVVASGGPASSGPASGGPASST